MKRSLLFLCLLSSIVLSVYPSEKVFANEDIKVIGAGEYTFSYPELKTTVFGERLSGKGAAIREIARNEYVAPTDAEVVFSPDKKETFTFSHEKSGKAVDEEKLSDDISAALSVGGGTISLGYKTVLPSVTEKELRAQTFERARFTTYFKNTAPERINNVRLAAKSVSGSVIESGEIFSFNETVGERSEKRGYMSAKIIKDGKFEDGLGGGVCQVSTTLYNACLLAGLTIEEYHPHTLSVSYIENSFDAMVNYGSADLKIKNDTGGKIFIAAYVDDNSVSFVLYGIKSDAHISRYSETEKIVKAKSETVFSDELPLNEEIEIVRPKDGAVSKGYLIIKKDGKTVKKLIRSDNYKPVDGVTKKGSASAEP